MSTHSYARCWLHLIWSTHKREKSLPENARKSLARYFYEYAKEKQIFLRINYVNADHMHALIDLPPEYTIADIAQLFKGSSSRWINEQGIVPGRFRWGADMRRFRSHNLE